MSLLTVYVISLTELEVSITIAASSVTIFTSPPLDSHANLMSSATCDFPHLLLSSKRHIIRLECILLRLSLSSLVPTIYQTSYLFS